MRKLQIGVIGSAGIEEYKKRKPNKRVFELAYEVGKLIADRNAILICGGKGGIMEATCRGAKERGGITVGIISGNKRKQANKYVDVEVVSGMVNSGEEALIISMSDGIIAIGGGSGTLQEITIAYRNSKPIVSITKVPGWAKRLANSYIDEREITRIKGVKTPFEAVQTLFRQIKK